MTESQQSAFHQYLLAGQTTVSNLVLHHYRQLGMSSSQLIVYLELKSYLDQGQQSPDINLIAQHLEIEVTQVYEILHQLISQQILRHETKLDKMGKETDYYSFLPLIDKLMVLQTQEKTKKEQTADINNRKQLFEKIEVEFGRQLSPIELETIGKWIDEDHYDLNMIELALQEAVLNQVWNLKYMDRILQNWEKQHITTPQQVQQARDKFNMQHKDDAQHHQQKKSGPQIPLFKIGDQ